MERLGIYTPQEVERKYMEKIRQVRSQYDRDQDLVSVAKELQRRHRYSDMYWGGACYFINLDQMMEADQDLNLVDLVQEYLKCCRMKEDSLEEVVRSWDTLTKSKTAGDLLESYRSLPARSVLPELY
jgi:negative regulator of genetic competence, sporulation and motility